MKAAPGLLAITSKDGVGAVAITLKPESVAQIART